jgi:hypothetical protein
VNIVPLPENQRIPIRIQPLKDLTGQSQTFEPSFDTLITLLLAPGLIEVVEPYSNDPSRAMADMSYQNPVRVLQTDDKTTPQYEFTGEIELISYGSSQDVKKQIAAYAMWGLWGLAAIGGSKDMVACVQYRIYLHDSKGVVIDNIVTIGVSSGNMKKKSRRQLTYEAISDAAGQFQIGLLKCLSKQGHKFDSQLIKWLSQREGNNKRTQIINSILRPNHF